MKNKAKFLIFDGNAIVHRSFHTLTNIAPAFDDEFERLTGKLQNDYMSKLPPDKQSDYQVTLSAGLSKYKD